MFLLTVKPISENVSMLLKESIREPRISSKITRKLFQVLVLILKFLLSIATFVEAIELLKKKKILVIAKNSTNRDH